MRLLPSAFQHERLKMSLKIMGIGIGHIGTLTLNSIAFSLCSDLSATE